MKTLLRISVVLQLLIITVIIGISIAIKPIGWLFIVTLISLLSLCVVLFLTLSKLDRVIYLETPESVKNKQLEYSAYLHTFDENGDEK